MKLVLTALALALGCAPPESDAVDSAAIAAAPPDSASPRAGESAGSGAVRAVARSVPGRPQEIYIDSISTTNPMRVFGRARTFENTVQVRARDAAGRVITEVFTTSVGEMGNHNPFAADVWLARDPGTRVTVEAFEYSAKDGSERSLTSAAVSYAIPSVAITLLFPVSDGCSETRPFARSAPKAVALARLIVEALVAGPDSAERAAGATSPFPPGARVRSVVLREGTLTVDFNERLQNVGGACAATAIRQSVTRTLQRLPAVKRVVITAFGSEKLALQP